MLDGLHLRETPLELVRDQALVAHLDELGAKVPAPAEPKLRELLDAINQA